MSVSQTIWSCTAESLSAPSSVGLPTRFTVSPSNAAEQSPKSMYFRTLAAFVKAAPVRSCAVCASRPRYCLLRDQKSAQAVVSLNKVKATAASVVPQMRSAAALACSKVEFPHLGRLDALLRTASPESGRTQTPATVTYS